MTDTGKRLGWLQALRGVAAVGVVTCHCLINLPKTPPYLAVIAVLDGLGTGVDLFFVISGFIMVHTTQGDPGGVRSAARFAMRRLQRIWPAYFVLTLAIGFSSFGWSLIGDEATRVRLVKSILFVPANYDGVYAHQIIAQGWTLGFEVYFYGIFAISLLFARARWIFLAAWWSVTLVAVPLAYHASLTDVFQSYATTDYPVEYLKLATNPFIWEFVAGGVAGLIYHSALRIESAVLCSALARAAIALAIWNTFDPFVSGALGVGLVFAMMNHRRFGCQQDNRNPRAADVELSRRYLLHALPRTFGDNLRAPSRLWIPWPEGSAVNVCQYSGNGRRMHSGCGTQQSVPGA